ncbi:hypothetical protein [Rhizobium halophilum]|uniref:hypothetical protein n=1 Tax=Rhizobium halophilum TaxID=2846852 RepID=UPI001EFEB5F2|nr:hypothetical protein [Rhizobium halophilum]MCF6371326.1 hypothetical protein [Rhizobium halophilum]
MNGNARRGASHIQGLVPRVPSVEEMTPGSNCRGGGRFRLVKEERHYDTCYREGGEGGEDEDGARE